MNYDDGSSYGYDQYYSNPAYLENPVATTSELLKRNANIRTSQPERIHAHKVKSMQDQQIDDIVQQELRNKVRQHIETYFDNKTNEVDYPLQSAIKKKIEPFEDPADIYNTIHPHKCFSDKSVDSQFILIILIILLLVLSIFQYAQAQSLRETIYNIMLSSNTLKPMQSVQTMPITAPSIVTSTK